ncbi:MAG: GNAT family N-acetyltransferase [Bacteroidia bacterium]
MLEILPYSDLYKEDIKRLNYEWLEKYFAVEPIDVKTLSDPKAEIIDKGGFIFFAKVDNEIAGTVSLLKVTDKLFEVGKMAVTEKFQGRKIGNLLMQACIDKAKETGAEKLFLLSNTKLSSAINLYRKFGFVEVPLPENSGYKRANIKMELILG